MNTATNINEKSRKICVVDSATEERYTQNDVERLLREQEEALSFSGHRYPVIRRIQRLYLDNGIRQARKIMPLQEGTADMYKRQKLTINGESQWYSYPSVQGLVDMVVEAVTNKLTATPQKTNRLLKDYMLEWYDTYKKPQLGDGYNANYMCMMNKHIIPAVGDKDISEITVADVQKIMDTLKSASTAKQVRCILNMVMEAAIADELYHHPNPTHDRRIVMPTARKKREAVSKQDMSKIIELLPTLPAEYSRILAMLIMTGARRGEVLGARWEDIDWTNNTIHLQRVVRFVNNRPVVSEKMKTKAANRVVSLWEELIPYLGEKQESGFIINRDGEPLSERMYRIRWQGILKHLNEAGIDELPTAHQFRHAYATAAANSGRIPPKVLQGMLGHANFQTTMNIYAGLDTDKVRESSRDLSEEYIKGTKKSCSDFAGN